jgi:transcriptional regulator with XRE-family HTH domain
MGSSRNAASMTRAVEIQPEGRFAQALAERMNENDVPVRQLAERTGLTYEHIRKLVKGAAFPSKLALREICRALDLPVERMQPLVVADRIEKKYGGIPHALAGKHPELSLLARWWDLLTAEQKDMFRIQIKSIAESNQDAAARPKPARGTAAPLPALRRLRS